MLRYTQENSDVYMRRFNPEKELRKLQYGNRNKILYGTIVLLLIISIGSTYALYQVRYSKRIIYTKVAPFSNNDINLAVIVDGKSEDDFPEKDQNKIYEKIDCGETKVKAYWDYDRWALVLETSKKAKCTVYFKTGTSGSETKPDTSGANPPELYQGLIPVKYEDKDEDGTPEIYIADPNSTDWYNYDAHEWANAVLINNKVFAADLSGNGNHGELVGGPQIADEGLVLDGNDDGIFLDDMVKDIFQHSNTIQIKVKRQETNAWGVLIGNFEENSYPFIQYEIDITNKHYLWWSHKADKTGGSYTSTDFVTITYIFDKENGTITVYNDNDESFRAQSDVYKSGFDNYINAYIGRDIVQTGVNSKSLQGIIEKVMIYDDILTESEIQHNLTAESGVVGNNGVVADNLHLYYDFKVPQAVDTTPGKKLNMNAISQMYVWIPRYKYQLFNAIAGNASTERMINIKFENGTQSTGDVTCTINEKGKETCTNSLNGNWYTHPAFKFGNTDLTGIWVGKFESSGSAEALTIKPNIVALKNTNISVMFEASRNIEEQYASSFNLKKEEIDTRMMKNQEWGAMAYLTYSKYGRCDDSGTCTEIAPNLNSKYITGYNGTAYTWETENGKLASTTGNLYGIYDTSGGAWEYMMSVTIDPTGSDIYYSNSGLDASTMPEEKYYELYEYDTVETTHQRGHLGDATRETLKTFGNTTGGWYNDTAYFPYKTSSWLDRSGEPVWGDNNGAFAFARDTGGAFVYASFRVVLTAQDGNK